MKSIKRYARKILDYTIEVLQKIGKKALIYGAVSAIALAGCACLKPAQKTEPKPVEPPAAKQPSDGEYKNLPLTQQWLLKFIDGIDFGSSFTSHRNDWSD